MEKIMVYDRHYVMDYDGYKLSDLVEKFGGEAFLSVFYGHYYNEQDLAYFVCNRLETDEEFNSRKKALAKQKRDEKKKLKLKKEEYNRKNDAEYQEYLKLKKKFEK